MATDPLELSIEGERQALLKEWDAEQGADWRTQFAPGTMGCHELLDRLSLVAKLLDEAIVDHPACVQRPDWYARARLASETLNDLYQKVGTEHL